MDPSDVAALSAEELKTLSLSGEFVAVEASSVRLTRLFLLLLAGELAAGVRSGALSASELTRLFSRQSVRAQSAFNCVTEVLFTDALAQAKRIDSSDAKQSAESGDRLLQGVPISIKDSVSVAGFDNTLGLANSIDIPAPEDAVLLTALKAAGAIPIVKSNVPQT